MMRGVRREAEEKIDGRGGDREANRGGSKDGRATGSKRRKRGDERAEEVRRKRWVEACEELKEAG